MVDWYGVCHIDLGFPGARGHLVTWSCTSLVTLPISRCLLFPRPHLPEYRQWGDRKMSSDCVCKATLWSDRDTAFHFLQSLCICIQHDMSVGIASAPALSCLSFASVSQQLHALAITSAIVVFQSITYTTLL